MSPQGLAVPDGGSLAEDFVGSLRQAVPKARQARGCELAGHQAAEDFDGVADVAALRFVAAMLDDEQRVEQCFAGAVGVGISGRQGADEFDERDLLVRWQQIVGGIGQTLFGMAASWGRGGHGTDSVRMKHTNEKTVGCSDPRFTLERFWVDGLRTAAAGPA